jgi:hypothetical protein
MIFPKYISLEKDDYCPLDGKCKGENCKYGHWKDNGCSIYFKTKDLNIT